MKAAYNNITNFVDKVPFHPPGKFGPTKYAREKLWTHEIPTRKNVPTSYQRRHVSMR